MPAYNSKARDSAQVPVDYTLIKNVKKPSGAKPGMVIFVDYRTAYVMPDEQNKTITGFGGKIIFPERNRIHEPEQKRNAVSSTS